VSGMYVCKKYIKIGNILLSTGNPTRAKRTRNAIKMEECKKSRARAGRHAVTVDGRGSVRARKRPSAPHLSPLTVLVLKYDQWAVLSTPQSSVSVANGKNSR
jgi:hypothetical protein